VAVRSAIAVGVVVVVGGVSEVHDNKTIRKPASSAKAVRDTAVRAGSTGWSCIKVGFPNSGLPTKPGGACCWRSG
jgi:hypothetical protein